MSPEDRCRAAERFFHEQIPLTRALAIEVESCGDDGFILRAPLSANHNHLGTAFGGSLAAIALLAGYGLLWLELDDRSAHLVVSETQIKYQRPVRGTIRAVCRRPAEAELAEFKANLANKGKSRLRLEVLIEENGEAAVIFLGTYVAAR